MLRLEGKAMLGADFHAVAAEYASIGIERPAVGVGLAGNRQGLGRAALGAQAAVYADGRIDDQMPAVAGDGRAFLERIRPGSRLMGQVL